MRRIVIAILFACVLLSSLSKNCLGHDPSKVPTKEELEKLAREGKLEDAQRRLSWLNQHRIKEGLGNKAYYRLQQDILRGQGKSEEEILTAMYGTGPNRKFPYTGVKPELKSTGTVKTLTVLIDFKDHKAPSRMTPAHFQECIYGSGTSTAIALHAPYESLNAYYKRASEGKLDIQGNVLPWYSFPNNRSTYEPTPVDRRGLTRDEIDQREALENQKALFALISTAIDAANTSPAGHDFAQYDNDNDGDIDCVNVLYAGRPGTWSSFWWAYQWQFYTTEAANKKFDGKRIRQFVFQFIDQRGHEFDPTTLMHETGHALGLPDYYDYKAGVGPDGGIGRLDMMDGNWGNHNAFSRWLLDWITPTIVSSGDPSSIKLSASGANGTDPKAIAISPNQTSSTTPEGDIYIIEHRSRQGNDGGDKAIPGDGVLIWRVDATPNASNNDFEYDNSYTDKKLIQLVRPDSANDFSDREEATAGVFFNPGEEFTPSSTPVRSEWGVTVEDLEQSADGTWMKLVVGFSPTPDPNNVASSDDEKAVESDSGLSIRIREILGSKEPLGLKTIDEIVEAASNSTPGAVKAAIEEIKANLKESKPSLAQQVLFENLTLALASKNGANALSILDSATPLSESTSELRSNVMSNWFKNDPQGALKSVRGSREFTVLTGPNSTSTIIQAETTHVRETSLTGGPYMEFPPFAGPRPAASVTLQVASYNVESGDAKIDTLADVVESFSNIDIWGFSEVDGADWADKLEVAAEDGESSTYGQILGTTGSSDRLLIVYNESKLTYVDDFELHEINPRDANGRRRVRSALVGHFKIAGTGQEIYFMVNHLYRGDINKRHEQSMWLNSWAKSQTVPIIAVGDYNYDWEVVGGDTDHDDGFDLLTDDNVFQWVRPASLIKTQTDPAYNSVLDFVFASELAWPFAQSSTIVVRSGDEPDNSSISDHRPVIASFNFAAPTPGPTPTPTPGPRLAGPGAGPLKRLDWNEPDQVRSPDLSSLTQEELLEMVKRLQRDLREQKRLAAGLD